MDSNKKHRIEKQTDGAFARMLRIALNLLRDHISSKDLYGHLIPKAQGHPMTVFCKISIRRSKNCLEFSIGW